MPRFSLRPVALSISAISLALLVAGNSLAEEFPMKDKPITLVVPFAAGGPTDRVARDLAEALRKPLGGANVIVENIAGAAGSIGANKIAKAPADGHSLLLFHIGMATLPSLLRNMPYKVDADFEYLGLVNEVPMTLVARPTLAANNYSDLATWAQQNQGKVTMGHAGIGSASHLCGLMVQSGMKIDMTTIAYKGTAPAMNDLVNGQIDLMCDQTTQTTTQIEAKKIKAYAVTTNKRLTTPALKDLPTLQEAGLKGLEVSIWHGLYAPKGTPAAVQKKLNDALKIALKDPDFLKKQDALGAVIVTDKRMEPAEHKKFVMSEIAKWEPVIKAAGVYAD
jgi:tripartite-type tricarboxylate transporter receptor subunit TctC